MPLRRHVDPRTLSYNALLVNTGSKVILIDAGTGGAFASSPMFRGTGRVLDNLRAAGDRPEDVDGVYISHLGPTISVASCRGTRPPTDRRPQACTFTRRTRYNTDGR